MNGDDGGSEAAFTRRPRTTQRTKDERRRTNEERRTKNHEGKAHTHRDAATTINQRQETDEQTTQRHSTATTRHRTQQQNKQTNKTTRDTVTYSGGVTPPPASPSRPDRHRPSADTLSSQPVTSSSTPQRRQAAIHVNTIPEYVPACTTVNCGAQRLYRLVYILCLTEQWVCVRMSGSPTDLCAWWGVSGRRGSKVNSPKNWEVCNEHRGVLYSVVNLILCYNIVCMSEYTVILCDVYLCNRQCIPCRLPARSRH